MGKSLSRWDLQQNHHHKLKAPRGRAEPSGTLMTLQTRWQIYQNIIFVDESFQCLFFLLSNAENGASFLYAGVNIFRHLGFVFA